MSRVRTMFLGLRSWSQSALKVCAFQNLVQPITSLCFVGFENYLVQMIIMTRQYVVCKNNVARSKVKVTVRLKGFAFQNHVQPFTSSCMVGFESYLAQMIIIIRQCVMCKNHIARSKVKVTVRTYSLFIGFCETCLCLAHNFVIMHAPGMV